MLESIRSYNAVAGMVDNTGKADREVAAIRDRMAYAKSIHDLSERYNTEMRVMRNWIADMQERMNLMRVELDEVRAKQK